MKPFLYVLKAMFRGLHLHEDCLGIYTRDILRIVEGFYKLRVWILYIY